MNTLDSLSGEVLGRITLLQSMVTLMPDQTSMLKFICQGLKDMSGVRNVEYRMSGGETPFPDSGSKSADTRIFTVRHKAVGYAELRFDISERDAFEPYVPFIQNFANMLAVIFEERAQSKLNESLMSELETRVSQRTVELRASEEKYREIIEGTSDLITSTDASWAFTFVNHRAEVIFGVPAVECAGKSAFAFIHPDDRLNTENRFRACADRHVERDTFENRQVHRTTGEIFHFLWTSNFHYDPSGRLLWVNSIAHDITALKQAEKEHVQYELQMQKTQKLEALGVLAGGIAHDFNNLMGGIFGFIDMANEETDRTVACRYLAKAMTTIDRARGLTGQLLTFAKGGAPARTTGRLFPFVQETALFALSGANVSCRFDVHPDLRLCNFDRNQIGQVIDNIIINAQQAMPMGGIIELTARNVTVGEKDHATLEKGDYIRISIRDSGVGIPADMIARIFDPFFTTKTKGHGLGLATCHSIIRRHDGCIEVESEPARGSAFHVYLPASADPAASTEVVSAVHRGNGTVIVMDDEAVMRETIATMLTSFGYAVICSADGKAAVESYAAQRSEGKMIVCMFFDLTVPGGMGGSETVREIRKTTTEIPVFVISGYAEDPVMKSPVEYGFTASICKPFRKTDLAVMLNRHLKPADHPI